MNDVLDKNTAAARIEFRSRMIDAAGAKVAVAEAGEGEVLVYLASAEDALASLLARHNRVVAVAPDERLANSAPSAKARRIADIAAALGVDQYCLLAEGADALAALSLAAEKDTVLQRMVLVSPQAFGPGDVLDDPALAELLPDVECDSLLLFGTDGGGASSQTAAVHREKIPKSHLMYVFDAKDPARSRPEAAASVIGDFLRRGDGFLVSDEDGRLYP